jgi:hypothetical protein
MMTIMVGAGGGAPPAGVAGGGGGGAGGHPNQQGTNSMIHGRHQNLNNNSTFKHVFPMENAHWMERASASFPSQSKNMDHRDYYHDHHDGITARPYNTVTPSPIPHHHAIGQMEESAIQTLLLLSSDSWSKDD